jgi:hypothetical protein
MAFILSKERESDVVAAFERYKEYLRLQRHHFPEQAYRLATSEWYFNPNDHRCPPDAWLDNVTVSEAGTGERPEMRGVTIRIRLVGAYHDCLIELPFPRVFRYRLQLDEASNGHCDWRFDEFRLNESGTLQHEIEWWGPEATGRWLIEASDVEFTWRPNEASAPI